MISSRSRALFTLSLVIATVLIELVAIAECGHGGGGGYGFGGGGHHKKGGGQQNMEELLLLTGILAKVLQSKGGGHHKSSPIPIPIYIPIHGGHHHG